MTREEATALIEKQFADGVLPDAEKQALDGYLAEHPEMRAVYQRYANLEVALAGDLAPPALQERIMARAHAASAVPAPIDLRSRPRRRWSIAAVSGVAIAAAASIVLFIAAPPPAPLPDYAIDVSRGAQGERRAEPPGVDSVPLFRPTTSFELFVTPDVAVDGELAVRAAFVGEGGAVPVPSRWARTKGGGFELVGLTGADLGLAPGDWTVVVAVGRPGALPPLEGLAGARASEQLRVVRASVRYEDAQGP